MIQVYKKGNLYIVADTVRDIVYPNLTAEEAKAVLTFYGREIEDRLEYAMPYSSYAEEYYPKELQEWVLKRESDK